MLILVATPIGNLSDISENALHHLRSCDYILCEDTRHSQKLLLHYSIKKPLYSYHKFNEKKELAKILGELKTGKTICLISDAGTPCISDPGSHLIDACYLENIPITSCPGPSSLINALALSGFLSDKQQFIGFLPRQESEKKQALLDALTYAGVTVFFETPQRLQATLSLLAALSPESDLFVAREMTKKYEELLRDTCQNIAEHFSKTLPKGEFVLCLRPQKPPKKNDWEQMSEKEHVEHLQNTFSISKKEAIKLAAEQRGVKKQLIYKKTI